MSKSENHVMLIILIIGGLIAVGAYKITEKWEHHQFQMAFRKMVESQTESIVHLIHEHQYTVQGAGNYVVTLEQVTNKNLKRYVLAIQNQNPSMMAMYWVPKNGKRISIVTATLEPETLAKFSSVSPVTDLVLSRGQTYLQISSYVQKLNGYVVGFFFLKADNRKSHKNSPC